MAKSKRDANGTRRRILDAALRAFSTVGYSAARVRDIANEADANIALVSRYFGSKLGLFRAALAEVLDPLPITGGGATDVGARLTALFLDTPRAVNPLPMLLLAAADPEAHSIAQALLAEQVVRPVAAWLDGPDADARAARLIAVATGFYVFRLLYPLPPMTGAVDAGTRSWLERTLQNAIEANPA